MSDLRYIGLMTTAAVGTTAVVMFHGLTLLTALMAIGFITMAIYFVHE